MTEHEILREYLFSRGFCRVRIHGKILDAAAVLRSKQYAFCIVHSEVTFVRDTIQLNDIGKIKTLGKFAFDSGYDKFFVVAFHPNNLLSFIDIKKDRLEMDCTRVRPDRVIHANFLLDMVCFSRCDSNIKPLNGNSACEKKYLCCAGFMYSYNKKETIECLMRDTCLMHDVWKDMQSKKGTFRLAREYTDFFLDHVVNITMFATDFNCKYYSKTN